MSEYLKYKEEFARKGRFWLLVGDEQIAAESVDVTCSAGQTTITIVRGVRLEEGTPVFYFADKIQADIAVCDKEGLPYLPRWWTCTRDTYTPGAWSAVKGDFLKEQVTYVCDDEVGETG